MPRRRQTPKALGSLKKSSSDSQSASGHDRYLCVNIDTGDYKEVMVNPKGRGGNPQIKDVIAKDEDNWKKTRALKGYSFREVYKDIPKNTIQLYWYDDVRQEKILVCTFQMKSTFFRADGYLWDD